MAGNQQTGRVIRNLPGHRVVVQLPSGQQLTASAVGITPRPGAGALIANPGRGWVVLAWQ